MAYLKQYTTQERLHFLHMAPASQITLCLSNAFLAFESKSLPNLHLYIVKGCSLPWGLQEKFFWHLHKPVSNTSDSNLYF